MRRVLADDTTRNGHDHNETRSNNMTNKKLNAIVLTALMVLSVLAISGSGLGANVQRGGDERAFNPGVGGPNQVVITEDKPVVFRGEDDVDMVDENGTEIDPSNLIGVSGDAEGIPLETPIPEDQVLGQYAVNGQRDQPGVTVQQPRVTDLELLNERGADVADSSVPEDEIILVRAEWNYEEAEDLDLNVLDENGNEVTGDVLANADQLSEDQISELNGPYADTPQAVTNPGQRGTGTERVYLQGAGQFNDTAFENTTFQDAFWAIDLSDQDAGNYTITIEGWDELDFGPASQSASLDVTTEDDIQLDLDNDSATRGEYVPYTIRGSSAGNEHIVTIEDDDFRNNNVDERVFRDVEDVEERGTVDTDDDGNADYAYARVIVDEDTGLGQGQLDSTYLDDTNVDINVYESDQTLEDVTADFNDPEDDIELRVQEGTLTIVEPAGTYIAGQEVDVTGTAQQGIDDVALYARDQGDWELLDVNENGELSEGDLISVDADGVWEEDDVRLSEATDIFAIPGRYRFGVIEAEDARGDDGELRETLTTSEFSAGTSEQTSVIVTEPGLGPGNESAALSASLPSVTGATLQSVQQPMLQLAQQENETQNETQNVTQNETQNVTQNETQNETVGQADEQADGQVDQTTGPVVPQDTQRPLIFRSYNGQVATEDGTVDVLGTAPGQDDVLLVMIDTRGRVATEQVTVDDNDVFEEDDISLTTADGRQLNEGEITAIAYATGRDNVAGDGIIPGENNADLAGVENYVQRFSGTGLTQQQVFEILSDETVDEAGSDDLFIRDSFRYTDGATSITAIRAQGANETTQGEVEPGDTMIVRGVTNRKPDDNTISVDVTEGPSAAQFPANSTDQWTYRGQWRVTLQVPEDAEPGSYTIEADDGDNTDIVEFQVVEQTEAAETPTPENETATPMNETAGDGAETPGNETNGNATTG